MSPNSNPTAALKGVVVCVAAVGIVFTLGSLVWFRGDVLSVGSGALVAVLHLLAVAYGVNRALNGGGVQVSRVLFALLKLVVLLGGLAWLAHSKVLGVLPFLVGYSAMPLGIVLAQVSAFGSPATAKHSNQARQG